MLAQYRGKESMSSISFAYFIMPTSSHSFRETAALGAVTLSRPTSGAPDSADPADPLDICLSHFFWEAS